MTEAATAVRSPAGAAGGWLVVAGDLVHTGGMDRANLALADYLARHGGGGGGGAATVHVVAFRVEASLARRPNVAVHRVRKPFNAYTLGLPLLAAAGRKVARQVSAAGGRVVVNGGNCPWPDVNWVHYVHHAHAAEARAGPLASARALIVRRRELARERQALARAKCVIVNSKRTRAVVLAIGGVREDRVHVVYYGTDPEVFRPEDDPTRRAATRRALGCPVDGPLAVFVGGLGDRRKGFDVVFDAYAAAAQQGEAGDLPRLLVIGRGAESAAWERRIAAAGLAEQIRLIGFREDVPEIVRSADLLVAPTRYEAYGLAVHEALCCGVPALVTKTAGVAERYPAGLASLLLDDPPTPDDLRVKMAAWAAGRADIAAAVHALSDDLRRRTWDDMAAEIVHVALATT